MALPDSPKTTKTNELMKKYNLITTALLLVLNQLTIAQKVPCSDPAGFSKDTTITLEDGTQVIFNRCEFFDVRDCLEIQEIRDLPTLEQSGMSMMDNEGNILLTCGMVQLKYNKDPECTNLPECFTTPFKIRIPAMNTSCINSSDRKQLYRSGPTRIWTPVPGGKLITDSSGKQYFEFTTTCVGGYNCDQRLNTFPVKFKSKHLKEITSLRILSNCPPIALEFTPGRRSTIVWAKLACLNPDSVIIQVKGEDRNGNGVEFKKSLSQLKTNYRRTLCTKESDKAMRRILGIFPRLERRIYRKYLVD